MTRSGATASAGGGAVGRGRGRRWRVLAVSWLTIGLLAAAGSAVWASGFVSASAEIGDTADAEPVLASEGETTEAPEWVGAGSETLTFDFHGTWAEVNAAARLFEVDLSEEDPGHVFQVGVYSTGDLDDSGWTELQVALVTASGSCDEADLDDPEATEALDLLASSDAGWVMALDGGTTTCVGVPADGRADDGDGMFARRTNATTEPEPPVFTASVNRIE